MKYTLLDVVQILLSSTDSDEVNSISDTVESMQAAEIARQAYLNIVYKANLPESKTLFELNPSLTTNLPTVMYRPDAIQDIQWIKYNKATAVDTLPNFSLVDYVCLEEFFDRMYSLKTGDPNTIQGTLVLNGSDTITLFWQNSLAPSYWTSFDDKTILFDSYDATVDSTLQKTKTLAYGTKSFTFTMSDIFVPDLDEPQHQLWVNEAKALGWAELKQTTHQKAEIEARRGWVNLMKTKRSVPEYISPLTSAPDYGRRSSAGLGRTLRKGRNSW